MNPKVSVCIISYNHERYIAQCIEGILMQKVDFPIEIVIGEDCSTDSTRSIIASYQKKYPEQIFPIYHDKNVGAARNGYEFCLPKLRGEFVAICEGDDFWTDPYKLQKQVDFLTTHEEYSFCFHRVDSVDSNGKQIDSQVALNGVVLFDEIEILRTFVPTLSIVYRNQRLELPKEIFEVKSGDVFLVAMLAKYGKAADLGFIGASYRKHQGGVYSGLNKFHQLYNAIFTRRKMLESNFFTDIQKNEFRAEISRRKRQAMVGFLKSGSLVNMLRVIAL